MKMTCHIHHKKKIMHPEVLHDVRFKTGLVVASWSNKWFSFITAVRPLSCIILGAKLSVMNVEFHTNCQTKSKLLDASGKCSLNIGYGHIITQ